jgi:predicted nuclease of predicted toxin-antitoxin system
VKLLFDANLSPALVARLHSEYPDSTHVREIGLRSGSDEQIWDVARTHGFTVVSKDTDFRERSFVEGFPPKVVWLDVGNAGTGEIEALLRRQQHRVEAFGQSTDASLLILSLGASAV